MYKINKNLFLSAEENEQLLNNELYLVKVNHVDTVDKVPQEYSFKYTEGVDVDLF